MAGPQAAGAVPSSQLDDVQRSVIATDSHTLLLGPAGTGKSTALVHATAALADRWGAGCVVGVASDRTAARSWQGQVAPLVEGAVPPITTLAALAVDLVAGAAPAADTDEAPRVLTGPEQELRVRELLDGTLTTAGNEVEWPPEWKPALPTRSFARVLRRCLAQARRTGWDPRDLRAAAVAANDPGWAAVADFLAEYLDVLDWEGAIDYAELGVRALRAVTLAPPTTPLVVILDDAQHLDPVQAQLVTTLTGRGGLLVAAADPDQCMASYRGADLAALTALADTCQVRRANRVYRGGSAGRDARRNLLGSRWYAGLPAEVGLGYRTPAVVHEAVGTQLVAVEFDDPVAQALHLADRLRAAHRDGIPWRDMAVLVTSPAREMAPLVRGLAQAHIPLHVPTTDVPLAAQPAVATLVAAAEVVLDGGSDPASWKDLVCSDMMGLPPREWRALLRVSERRSRSVADLWRDPLAASEFPEAGPALRVLTALDRRLDRARRRHLSGGTPAEVLWDLWHGGDDVWPERLRRRALTTGEGAVAAGRDLDSVIQLFRLAERAPERWGGQRGLRSLLDEIDHHEIAAEPDLKAASRSDSVSVLSLHRSPGHSWPLVVVTGLTEAAWTATDSIGLIDPGRLTADTLLPMAPRRAAAERRRLLTMALGRASRQLILCAAGGADDPPTALLADAGITIRRVVGRPAAPQTPLDLILRARSEMVGHGSAETAARSALQRLGALRDTTGAPVCPGADPRRWPGVADWSIGPVPLRRPDRPLSLSASGVALLDECPLRWLLQREARGDRTTSPAADFGLMVHEGAALLVREPDTDPRALVDRLWSPSGYDASWYEAREQDMAALALRRAAAWLATRPVPVLAEHPIDQILAAGSDLVRVRGSVDVVEVHPEHVLVWDHKTRRSVASTSDSSHSVQLGIYQWALQEALGRPAEGAGLVHLCVAAGTKEPDLPKVREQPPLSDRADWIGQVVTDAAAAIRAEQFRPRPGAGCRTCPFQSSCPAQGGGS